MFKIAEQLLLQVKMEQPTAELINSLEGVSFETLSTTLNTNEKKNAFWFNLYNAFFLILKKERNIDKPAIYKNKLIQIAGIKFSLDDIEHGILRRYRYKYLLGFLPSLFVASHIKKLAVSKVDYRIHFALNCGAKSCPPIAFYNHEKINDQLELATLSFLESETDIIESKKEIHITRLFLWYMGDFGGRKGIRRILKDKLNINTKGYKLVYKEYDWEEDLENFVEEV